MSSWHVFVATLVVIGVTVALVMIVRSQRTTTGYTSVADIRERLLTESSPPDMSVAAMLSHHAPERRLAVEQAHRTMQQHLDCTVADCPRKAAAYAVLVDAGRITPR